MNRYVLCDESLPPENEVVETVSDGGQVQHLKRLGRLWFLPDGSSYVYYTPTMWRRIGGVP